MQIARNDSKCQASDVIGNLRVGLNSDGAPLSRRSTVSLRAMGGPLKKGAAPQVRRRPSQVWEVSRRAGLPADTLGFQGGCCVRVLLAPIPDIEIFEARRR